MGNPLKPTRSQSLLPLGGDRPLSGQRRDDGIGPGGQCRCLRPRQFLAVLGGHLLIEFREHAQGVDDLSLLETAQGIIQLAQ